jgi:spermidine synthase
VFARLARRRDGPAASVIYLTVFLTGGAILVLEIIGTRFLAPFYGANLYSWSALITVTLIALAAGYYLGGRLADARGSPVLLDQVIGLSAPAVAAIPLLVRALAPALAGAGPRLGVVLSALFCFGPSLTLLGMVTPIAVRVAAPDFAHVGRSVGAVYAWSTAGSIAGALAAGFWLLPVFRVTRICYALALTVLVLALMRRLGRSRYRLAALLPPIALAAAVWGPAPESEPVQIRGFHPIATYPSFYGTVKVVEDKRVRYLLIDGMCHNAQSKASGNSVLPYVGVFGALPLIDPAGKELLLIGLGAGDMVRLLGASGIRTTAVEIDPVVAQAAFRHFGLQPDELALEIDDGRNALRRHKARFDFVIVDAFAGGSPAAHLFSREAFREMKAALRPGGIAAINVVTRSWHDALVADLAATLKSVFASVAAAGTATHPAALGNVIFFASDRPLALPAPFLAKSHARLLDLEPGSGRVLTDDANWLDALAAPVEEEMRRQARSVLPAALLAP